MFNRYALITGGIVTNIVEQANVPPAEFNPVSTNVAQVGWAYDGANFTAPPAPPVLALTQAQLVAAIDSVVQLAIDAKAQVRGYNDAATCISYMGSTNKAWAADASAMNVWRDECWTYVIAQEALPSLATPQAVVAGLPNAPW